jgi:ATP-dependent Clp protease protease subunit
MHFANLQPGLQATQPHLDDDDDDDKESNETARKSAAPVAALIQKKFLDQRKIFLWGAVTDETAKDLTEKLLYLEADAPGKEITFYMNTPGGSITAGMAVYDTMQMISSPITVIVTGMAASMGSILLSGAKKGRRFIYPHARVLIHQPLISGRFIGPATDWSGGTRIGECLKTFLDEHGRRGLARRAVVVVVSDGWDRSPPGLLGEQMRRLALLAHRIVWINPRQSAPNYQPLATGIADALPHCHATLAGHTLASLRAHLPPALAT